MTRSARTHTYKIQYSAVGGPREVTLDESDVYAWLRGYCCALGMPDAAQPVTGHMPERTRIVQTLLAMHQDGVITYQGTDEETP